MNKKSIINICFAIAGVAIFIFGLIKFINSFYFGDYGSDGSEFSFDTQYLCVMISGVILAGFNIYTLFHNELSIDYIILSLGLSNLIVMCYYLGTFLKQMFRDEPKDFADYKQYLVVGLVTLVLFVITENVGLIKYLKENK